MAGMVNLIFGYLVIKRAPATFFKYYFSVFIFATAVWIFSNFVLINLQSFFWLQTTYAFGAFVVAAALVWVEGFKNEEKPLSPFFLVGCYGAGFIFLGLCYFSTWFLKGIAIEGAAVKLVYGPFFPVYSVFSIGGMFFLLLKTLRYAFVLKGSKGIQARYIFGGLFGYILVTTIGTFVLPLFGWPQFAFLDAPSSLLFVGFTTYAITKHHLLDISVIISRTVAEILTVLFHGTIYLTLVWLYRNNVSASIDLLFLAWTVLYGIVVGQTHQKLRFFFQTTSDKIFLRGKYDYYRELSDASARVGEKLSLAHILGILYATFQDVVEISNPRVFLPDNFADAVKTSSRYVVYNKKTFLPESGGQEIKFDSHLVGDLIERRQPLFGVEDAKAPLVIPCLLEDRLIAIFALGTKLSEDPYTDDDLRLMQALASQAAVALDHTRSYEKIEADLEAAAKQLERSQRLVALGTLTAGVTHEIRNPLTVIRAETERIANQERDLDYLKNYKELVIKHITRIEGIVDRMLGLAREKQRPDNDVNLNELLDSIVQLFKFNGIALKKELQTIPTIKGNIQEIEQIFVNLVQNAIEAMPEGGKLEIKTYPQWGRVAVEISDTGKGIPKELQEKIFDPFFSTRHEGTGLGLSIAYRIIREHGGDIKVTSEVGKGTTFTVLF